MAATAARDAKRKEADVISFKLGAVKVYKGAMGSKRADGYVYPSRSGTATDVFVGVFEETIDNSGGAAGDKSALVRRTGRYQFAKTSAVIADLAAAVYASDDITLTATSTNNQLVGYPTALIDSSTLEIDIALAVK
jgi:hypothetical protein